MSKVLKNNEKKRKLPYKVDKFKAHTFHYFQPSTGTSTSQIIPNFSIVSTSNASVTENDCNSKSGGKSKNKKSNKIIVKSNNTKTINNNVCSSLINEQFQVENIKELLFQLNTNRNSINHVFIEFQKLTGIINGPNSHLLSPPIPISVLSTSSSVIISTNPEPSFEPNNAIDSIASFIPKPLFNSSNNNLSIPTTPSTSLEDCFLNSVYFNNGKQVYGDLEKIFPSQKTEKSVEVLLSDSSFENTTPRESLMEETFQNLHQ